VAKRFMAGLAAGSLDPGLLAPHSREALALLLAPGGPAAEGEGALPYRLGKIAIEGDTASLRVRLASGPAEGRIEGSLSLGEFSDSWYVESLSLDPAEVDKEGKAKPLVFDPDRGLAP